MRAFPETVNWEQKPFPPSEQLLPVDCLDTVCSEEKAAQPAVFFLSEQVYLLLPRPLPSSDSDLLLGSSSVYSIPGPLQGVLMSSEAARDC